MNPDGGGVGNGVVLAEVWVQVKVKVWVSIRVGYGKGWDGDVVHALTWSDTNDVNDGITSVVVNHI